MLAESMMNWLLQGQESILTSMLPFLVILAIFWLLFFRPQMKERKQQQAMRENLSKGDEVLTQGGILARVHSVKSDEGHVVLDLGNNAKLTVVKAAIISNRTKESQAKAGAPSANGRASRRKTSSDANEVSA